MTTTVRIFARRLDGSYLTIDRQSYNTPRGGLVHRTIYRIDNKITTAAKWKSLKERLLGMS
jgi:hypothetical protein